jgi:hypothetical protein
MTDRLLCVRCGHLRADHGVGGLPGACHQFVDRAAPALLWANRVLRWLRGQ